MANASFGRAQRVGESIQHELAQLLTNEVKDPRIGFVTVTEVRVTADLKSARVYVSVYGGAAKRQDTMKGLHAAAGFLKREVAHRLGLRFVPDLVFAVDETLDTADRMQRVMQAIAEGKTEVPDPKDITLAPAETFRTGLAERAQEFAAERAKRQKTERPSRRRRTRN